jgi:hypothetical protein
MMRLTLGLLALVLVVPLAAQRAGEMSQQDARWLGQARQRAYDTLMPLDFTDWRAIYRSHGDIRPDEIEQYFGIRLKGRGEDQFEAIIVVPTDGAFSRQLLNLRSRDATLTLDAAVKKLAFRRLVVDSASCHAVRDRMDALSNLSIALRDDRQIEIDPSMHRILVRTSSVDFDMTITNEKHPLVRWAAETHSALLACSH